MHGNRHTDDVCYQDEIAVGIGFVGAVLPFQHQPENQRGTEGREGIHFSLYSREPECIAPGISQGTTDTAGHYYDGFPRSYAVSIVCNYDFFNQMRYRPEQQQYCGCTQECRHTVYGKCSRCHGAAEERDEEAGGKHEDGIARRVTHFEFRAL